MSRERIAKGGYLYYDTPVGILCLESFFPKPLGHLRNPRTFAFPVIQKIVSGVRIPDLLFNPKPELTELFIDSAKKLEQEGVLSITGSCGFLARFQSIIAESVNIPVFLSSLLQIPLVRLIHGVNANIGILTASSEALTQDHFANVGSNIKDFSIKGMEGYSEFWETIIEGKRNDFNLDKLETEICHAASELSIQYSIEALILECTDLSAFSSSIQKVTSVPVYDINSLVEFVNYAVNRKSY